MISAVAALALPNCSIVFDAPDVTLLVGDDAIVFASDADADRLVGGETVLLLRNDSQRERRLVLARLPEGESGIPVGIRDAEDTRDDGRILAMTRTLDAKESTLAAGGLGFKVDSATMHVYLAAGGRYVVFDTMGDSVEMVLEPGR